MLAAAGSALMILAAAVSSVSAPALSVNAQITPSVISATIQGSNVVVASAGDYSGDDGLYYLYAQQPYESGVQGINVATAPAASGTTFTLPLGYNTPASNLNKKFQLAVRKNGAMVPVGSAIFITNPEAAATHTWPRRDFGKKGILPAAELLDNNDLTDLGVKQITYNVPLGKLTTGGGVNYTYNGKVYTFNEQILGQYDKVVPLMNTRGIQVTLILLNDLSPDPTLIHPLSRDYTGANYYAFNAADQAGVEKLAAVCTFLAERFSDTGHGTVDNWIIGNEVNARLEWHYMTAGAGLDTDAREYARALRVAYNSIRSVNANARVYACFDHEYAASDNVSAHYSGLAFMNAMNTWIRLEGDFDWSLAVHPYNAPLYDPFVWKPSVYTPRNASPRFLSMQNIDVLTDLMCTPLFLSPTGQVRSILLSEQGYVSSAGQQYQAASIVYAYMQAMANQHIDGFILSRQMDHAAEIAQGLDMGIQNPDGSHKLSYDWYKNVDSPYIQQQAAAVMGVSSVSELLTVR